MASSKPAIVLAPGSFCKTSFYAQFVYLLHEAGYDRIEIVRMPSLGDRSPLPAATADDDADYIRQIITEVSNEGYDVLLLAHSYGGIPATLAVKGVTKKEREAQGLKGGVRRLLYTTAVVPDLDGDLGSVMSAGTGAPPVSTIQMDVRSVLSTCRPCAKLLTG